MWNQIRLLYKLQNCNFMGLNQIKYGKDKKQRNRLIMMVVAYVIVGLMFAFYSGILAYDMGRLGMAYMVPAYAMSVISMMVLFFGMYKAGSVLFNMVTYEMTISLPVTPTAIVISRFLSMYVQNLVVGAVIMVPAAIVAGIMMDAGIGYYILMFLGFLLIPLIPMIIATAVGAAVTAVSARMKYKNLINILLTLIFTLGILVVSFILPGNMANHGTEVNLEVIEELLHNINKIVETQVYGVYPPARLFTAGVVEGNILSFLGFAAISIAGFLGLVALVQWKFLSISSALHGRRARKDYQMQELTQGGTLTALFKRELKRYFSSTIYVMNTLIGYLLMVIFAAFLFFMGIEELEIAMGVSGIVGKMAPLILALTCCITSTTVSSISMEGKQWWLVRSLPVSSKQIVDSKIMVNLVLAIPCLIVAEVFMFLAFSVTFLQSLWLILVPLAYIMMMSVVGLVINCKMPMFEWESEAVAVKQSGAVLVAMLVGFGSIVVPILLVLMVEGAVLHFIMGGIVVIVFGVTWLLYNRISRIDFRTVG